MNPSTYIIEKYAYDSTGFGMYTDEGLNSYIISNNVFMSSGICSAVNGAGTTNNTYTGNYYKQGATRQGNTQISDVNNANAPVAAKRIAYRAGVQPAKRTGRQISNASNLADGAVTLGARNGKVAVTVENFDDGPMREVEFVFGGSNAGAFSKSEVLSTVGGNGSATATFSVSGGGERVSVSVTVRYVNGRTEEKKSLSGSGTVQL